MSSHARGRQATNRVVPGTPIPDSPVQSHSFSSPKSPESNKGYGKLAVAGRKEKKTKRKTAKRTPIARDADGNREWSDYEMHTVLALLCKGVHRKKGGALTFATALNEALNGKRREHMDDDVDVGDVEVLLEWIYREKKGALAFIERQTTHCITRVARRVFHKNLPSDGSLEEWNNKASLQSAEATNDASLASGESSALFSVEDRNPRPSYAHRIPDSTAPRTAANLDLYGPRPTDTQPYSWLSNPIGQPQQPHPIAPPPHDYHPGNANYGVGNAGP